MDRQDYGLELRRGYPHHIDCQFPCRGLPPPPAYSRRPRTARTCRGGVRRSSSRPPPPNAAASVLQQPPPSTSVARPRRRHCHRPPRRRRCSPGADPMRTWPGKEVPCPLRPVRLSSPASTRHACVQGYGQGCGQGCGQGYGQGYGQGCGQGYGQGYGQGCGDRGVNMGVNRGVDRGMQYFSHLAASISSMLNVSSSMLTSSVRKWARDPSDEARAGASSSRHL